MDPNPQKKEKINPATTPLPGNENNINLEEKISCPNRGSCPVKDDENCSC
ncbi:MAG: hypothetical protein HQP61_11525 [Peptococcaceae bacterium]|nr:hypothetical protein [Candidatus Syntrophopropionicum ammoniitolerans]